MIPDQATAALARAHAALVGRGLIRGGATADRGRIVLTRPPDRAWGEWSSAYALQLARVTGADAREIAEALADELRTDPTVRAVHVAPTGHLNLTGVDAPGLVARQVLDAGPAYGTGHGRRAGGPQNGDPLAGDPENEGWPDREHVQYAASRCASVLRNADDLGIEREPADPELLTTPHEHALLDTLAELPVVAEAAAARAEPGRVREHLTRVADTYLEVQGRDPALPRGDEPPGPLHRARLLLVAATRQVLTNGLGLLGVAAPERM